MKLRENIIFPLQRTAPSPPPHTVDNFGRLASSSVLEELLCPNAAANTPRAPALYKSPSCNVLFTAPLNSFTNASSANACDTALVVTSNNDNVNSSSLEACTIADTILAINSLTKSSSLSAPTNALFVTSKTVILSRSFSDAFTRESCSVSSVASCRSSSMSDATNDSFKVAFNALELTDFEIRSAIALNSFSVCSRFSSSVIVFIASVIVVIRFIVAGLVKYLVTGVTNIAASARIANAMEAAFCGFW
mmetsp:Transcript_4586/g.7485  ORF Transcript_4586/g.7485 Transcript_4586/m.7485 type:complete len:249 (+) Transcript_4586:157-903(+)